MKYYKRVLLLLAITCVLALGQQSTFAATESAYSLNGVKVDDKAFFEAQNNRTVHVEAYNQGEGYRHSGTGFFVSNGYIVTCWHVVANDKDELKKNITITTWDKKTEEVTVVAEDKKLDIAILKTTMSDHDGFDFSDSYAVGEPIYTTGIQESMWETRTGTTDKYKSLIIPKKWGYIMLGARLKIDVDPGFSGGAVYARDGKLKGMVMGRDEKYGYAIYTSDIKNLIETDKAKML